MSTQDTQKEVLSADEAAELLGVHVGTVREMARKGEIPARKVGRDWRFVRSALIRWLQGDTGEG